MYVCKMMESLNAHVARVVVAPAGHVRAEQRFLLARAGQGARGGLWRSRCYKREGGGGGEREGEERGRGKREREEGARKRRPAAPVTRVTEARVVAPRGRTNVRGGSNFLRTPHAGGSR